MYAKITLAAFAVMLTAVSFNGAALAQGYFPYGADQNVNPFTSKIPSEARASQRRAYDRAFGGAYGAAPDRSSPDRVYVPNQYRPGQVFGAGVDSDFQLQRSN
jgi:hypothetical protein